MRIVLRLCVVVGLVLLQACASAPPAGVVPPGSTVPAATVLDSATGGGRGGGVFYFVDEIDGAQIPSIVDTSLRASRGLGVQMLISSHRRRLETGPHKLKLVGAVEYAAPIQSIFSSKKYRVEGVIDVTLRADVDYVVRGQVDAMKREVWLEEVDTGAIVGSKIIGKVDAAEAARAPKGEVFYTCCNLFYTDDWISDASFVDQTKIALGSQIVFGERGRNRVEVYIDGRKMRLGLDYGRGKEDIEALIAKVGSRADPVSTLTDLPPDLQQAIRAGKLRRGMTPEQVSRAIGHPRPDLNPSLTGKQWKYELSSGDEFTVLWSDDRRVDDVQAQPSVRRLVVAAE